LVLATLAAFCLLAKDSPRQPPPKKLIEYARPLAHPDAWRFCGFYCVTFGGFIGLASFLSLFFFEQYGQSRVAAGMLTALCVFSGSLLRPVGGYLADRWGGARLLVALFAAVAVLMGGVAVLPPLAMAIALIVVVMGLLGAGNGIVFQLIPQRFQREIGAMTGIVGAAGGVGGFLLPSLLGLVKGKTGSFSFGLLAFAAVCLLAAASVWSASRAWNAGRPALEPAAS
jgi:NNP family nitrate/nitrite transporter-like MFS transporter